MAIYDNLVAKLPSVMRQENTLKYYAAIAEVLEEFNSQFAIFENIHLLEVATGEWLDILGQYVNVSRNNENDEDYRARIKLEFYRYYFIPTLDNLLNFINSLTGVYPDAIFSLNNNLTVAQQAERYTVEELAEFLVEDFNQTEPAYIKFRYVFDPDFNIDILEQLDDVVGGGIRLENDIKFIFYARNHVAGTTVAAGGEFKRRITQRFVGT